MIDDVDKRQFYLSIVADKKPYFMRYIYPALSRQLNTYTRNANKNALREFGMSVEELLELSPAELTEEQCDFLRYYQSRMPTSNNDCVMNRICRRFEQEFGGYLGRHNSDVDFDYTVMRSDAAYAPSQYKSILQLYSDYNHRIREYTVFAGYERIDKYEIAAQTSAMRLEFEQECDRICPNRAALCNILLDICYRREATRKFAWDICGSEIISNLLVKRGRTITYPTLDADGDISYCGKRFSLKTKILEDSYEHSFE